MDSLDTRRNRPAETNTQLPLRETASQTAGPYVHIGCLPNSVGVGGIYRNDLTKNGEMVSGQAITIRGRVYEGEGIVCKDAMLEFWQADAKGDLSNGVWRRTGTDFDTGIYEIETVLPGGIADQDGKTLAPFITVWLAARGINLGLVTRIYFPHHVERQADDPQLALVPKGRRSTLIAEANEDQNEYRFDIHIQGERETVFFEV